jgi:hypothetical protein
LEFGFRCLTPFIALRSGQRMIYVVGDCNIWPDWERLYSDFLGGRNFIGRFLAEMEITECDGILLNDCVKG